MFILQISYLFLIVANVIFPPNYRMDDFKHMIESQQSDMEHQSQTITEMDPTVESIELAMHPPPSQSMELCASYDKNATNDGNVENESKVNIVDGASSVSANVDETLNPETDLNLQSMTDDIQSVVSNKSEDKSNETVENNETKNDESKNNKETINIELKNQDSFPADTNDVELDDELYERNSTKTKKINKVEDEIDLNQCRICMSSSDLLDIFRIGDKSSFRICDLVMKLAPGVKISERDYLPHSVCSKCVDRIEAAYELRIQCEETDKVLRSQLKRSKKTRRAPSEFVLIDCAESSSDSDDDQKSDDEFQLSEESEESSESDSESSYDEKKKRGLPNFRGRKRVMPLKRPNLVAHQSQQPMKQPRNSGVVYINATNSDKDDDNNGAAKPVKLITNRLQFRCDVCNRPCATGEALAQHRRTHANEKCKICSLVFKQRSAFLQHMQRHREDPECICRKCHRVFATKIECQRHVQTAHPETFACNKCKRCFLNKNLLDAHKCTIIESSLKGKSDIDTSASGKDLFKSVAPLTTTYWSDSFSD